MISTILIISLVVTAVSSAVLIHAVLQAPAGFEDDSGFHEVRDAEQRGLKLVYVGPERRSMAGNYAGLLRRTSDLC
jgi:hypothetical protein